MTTTIFIDNDNIYWQRQYLLMTTILIKIKKIVYVINYISVFISVGLGKICFLTYINPKFLGWVDQSKTHTKPNQSLVWVGLGWVQPTLFWRVIKNDEKFKRSVKKISTFLNFMLFFTRSVWFFILFIN